MKSSLAKNSTTFIKLIALLFAVGNFACIYCLIPFAPSPGRSDFSAKLVNGYKLIRSSGSTIYVKKDKGKEEFCGCKDPGFLNIDRFFDRCYPETRFCTKYGSIGIPTMVEKLDHDDRWIIAERQINDGYSPFSYDLPPDFSREGDFVYYIIDTTTDRIWGPIELSDFASVRAELGVPDDLKLIDVHDYDERRFR